MEIDWFRLVVGILAISFGAYSLFIRAKSPDSPKLNAIKNYWGEKKGNTIHLLFYGIVPIVLGIFMILKALSILSL